MRTKFPMAVPEIPVQDVDRAIAYYTERLGFRLDWREAEGGIAGISQGDCRMFLAGAEFRQTYGTGGPVMIWVNLTSKAEVDELYERWRAAGARTLEAPEDKPWHLREFRATDGDGNQLRVFYDFTRELRQE